MFRTIFRTAKW